MSIGYIIRNKYKNHGTPKVIPPCDTQYFDDWKYASISWMYEEIRDIDQFTNLGLKIKIEKINGDDLPKDWWTLNNELGD